MNGKNKTNKILIGIIICLIAVIIGGAIYFTRGTDQDKENKTPDSAFEPNLDSNASETASNDGNNEEADKPEGIRIPGYPSITVPADTTDIEMNLENPVGNPCYFTFELVLKDTNETLYTSKMVEPGKAITNVTLSHGLEKGEYPAVIKISTASLEDGSAMNGANVETTLIVQ